MYVSLALNMTATAPRVSADLIADLVHDTYSHFTPVSGKPRSNAAPGTKEWLPLAGIVLTGLEETKGDNGTRCVALGSGLKCLPLAKIKEGQGQIVHDSHAEILTLRAFNLYESTAR
jgi:tRNA-specific adenosine deaminase 1